MAQDVEELVVASFGRLYIGATTTRLPTEWNTALDAGFQDLGLATEDGVTFSSAPEVQEFFSWQLKSAARRSLTRVDNAITCTLQQWNALNFQTAFGGGEVEQVRSGSYRYSFPDDEAALQSYAMIVDWQDNYNYRLVAPSGNITESVEVQLQRTELSVLPVTFRPLGGISNGLFLLTNDPAFAEGS